MNRNRFRWIDGTKLTRGQLVHRIAKAVRLALPEAYDVDSEVMKALFLDGPVYLKIDNDSGAQEGHGPRVKAVRR